MNTKALERFAQSARRQLQEQVAARLARVLTTDSAELRAKAKAVKELQAEIQTASKQAVVERVAYTWFNRFCALRYMDVNGYTRTGVVSPAVAPAGETFTHPEILQEAKQGVVDASLEPFLDKQRVFDLLAGRVPAADPQQEAYRLLLVATCNDYHQAMPFLFEQIDDYTELLMPDDLLSAGSILQAAREALTLEACRDVEVIGWLYQFYISERKDEVIGAKKPISPADIPAATQLFTPDWIVRYLVENSLGRLWLLNRPQSRLADCMTYYIRPDEKSDFSEKSDFLRVNSPEELKVCDPAVGSAHMLTYAFDLLYLIYEEEGYNPTDIPRLILQKNLYGMEIDERAAALAAFALVVKARAKDRRFFRRGVRPHICLLQPIRFAEGELAGEKWLKGLGSDLREAALHDLNLFQDADNFGSLLRPKLTPGQISRLTERLAAHMSSGQMDWMVQDRRRRLAQALKQTGYLAQKYHVVVANPPYLGNMNDHLKKFAQDEYPDSKTDLFAMFIERNLDLAATGGFVAMITMQSWMFLSSYEKLRAKLLDQNTIRSMAHLGARAFDTIGGEVVSTTAFVLQNRHLPDVQGDFLRLVDGRSEAEKAAATGEAIQNPDCGWFYRATAVDFKKIPGSPIAYWLGKRIIAAFDATPLAKYAVSAGRCKTHNDLEFVRYFWEVSRVKIGPLNKWKMLSHGGEFRKWFGGRTRVFDWCDTARLTYAQFGGLSKEDHWNKVGITWSDITSNITGFRLKLDDSENSSLSPTLLPNNLDKLHSVLGFLNSKCAQIFLRVINSTFHTNPGDALRLPYNHVKNSDRGVETLIMRARSDWDSFETSTDFFAVPLLLERWCCPALAATYAALRRQWQTATLEMQRLEEENNRLFIEAYGLQDELTPDVPLAEITLTCNPHYRYGSNQLSVNSEQLKLITDNWPLITDNWPPGEKGLELRLLADTMREFISYAVGCMFGRYSLDKPGLILANQGETINDYLHKVAPSTVSFRRVFEEESFTSAGGKDSSEDLGMTDSDGVSFIPDRDNVIPMLDGDWFTDDISERFKLFLRVTFGDEHYSDNLAFIEAAIGRDIRSYFLRDFYKDHVKMYKKRPIYWLFSSAKGSFNALIYMHRYRPDTVSIVLNDYLREFRAKLTARKAHLEQVSISASASAREKTQALKEIDRIAKILHELRDYEDDILYPLATRQVQIDLDDGVKVNYNKFGRALKKITGLSE